MAPKAYVLLLLLGCACVAESSESGDNVAALLAQLSDADFDVRNAATEALIKLGDAAWPAVQAAPENADLERTARLRRIAGKIAVVPADQRAAADAAVALLLDPADGLKREKGVTALRAMGAGGRRLLIENITAAGAQIEFTASSSRRVITLGDTIVIRTHVRNNGSTCAWLSTWAIRGTGHTRRLFSNIGGCGSSSGGVRRPSKLTMSNAIPVLAQTTYSKQSNVRPYALGCFRYHYRLSLADRAAIDNDAEPIMLNEELFVPGDALTRSAEVIVLPDLQRHGPEDPVLQASVAPGEAVEGGEEGVLSLQYVLRNRLPQPVLLRENDIKEAWYLWLTAAGEPAEHGSLEIAAYPDNTADSGDIVLAPNGALYCPLHIPKPSKEDRYALLLGFGEYDKRAAPKKGPLPPGMVMYNNCIYLRVDDACVVGKK